MGVVEVNIITFIDKNGALPGNSQDVHPYLWRFMAKQCSILSSTELAMPIIVRSANLCNLVTSMKHLPKTSRPIVRTTKFNNKFLKPIEKNNLFSEDKPGHSIEWSSVISGYNYLNSGLFGNYPFNLWVIGAADLCEPVISNIPGPKRLIYAYVSCVWPSPSWKPDYLNISKFNVEEILDASRRVYCPSYIWTPIRGPFLTPIVISQSSQTIAYGESSDKPPVLTEPSKCLSTYSSSSSSCSSSSYSNIAFLFSGWKRLGNNENCGEDGETGIYESDYYPKPGNEEILCSGGISPVTQCIDSFMCAVVSHHTNEIIVPELSDSFGI
ncbi:Us2 homologue, partial [Phocid alphaherpesvirus 1]